MPKCKYDWPEAGERHLIGNRIERIDGPMKSSGRAKYTYDVHPIIFSVTYTGTNFLPL